MKVISLNIWGGELLNEAIQFLREESADILILQEVHVGAGRTFETLLEAFPEYRGIHAPTSTSSQDGIRLTTGNAILTRLPVLSHSTRFFDVPYDDNYQQPQDGDWRLAPRNLLHAILDWNGRPLHAVCVHGIWDWEGRDTERRLAMSRAICEEVAGQAPLVMAGDFNMDPDTQSIRQIENHLTNLFAPTTLSTFNMRRKSKPVFAELAVDMMFVSPDLTAQEIRVPNIDISDHLPLVAELA